MLVARRDGPLGEHLDCRRRRPAGDPRDERRRGGVEGQDEHDQGKPTGRPGAGGGHRRPRSSSDLPPRHETETADHPRGQVGTDAAHGAWPVAAPQAGRAAARATAACIAAPSRPRLPAVPAAVTRPGRGRRPEPEGGIQPPLRGSASTPGPATRPSVRPQVGGAGLRRGGQFAAATDVRPADARPASRSPPCRAPRRAATTGGGCLLPTAREPRRGRRGSAGDAEACDRTTPLRVARARGPPVRFAVTATARRRPVGVLVASHQMSTWRARARLVPARPRYEFKQRRTCRSSTMPARPGGSACSRDASS